MYRFSKLNSTLAFVMVACEGSVSRASDVLNLSETRRQSSVMTKLRCFPRPILFLRR